MTKNTLTEFLAELSTGGASKPAVAALLARLAEAAARVAGAIADGATSARLAEEGEVNVQGEVQKYLDLFAHEAFLKAARAAPVAHMLSEEEEEPIVLTAGAPLALAIDPLDGSSNIAINSPIGTIFGIYPAEGCSTDKSFLRRGRHLLAAGYVIYGARTELVVSAGGVPRLYVLGGKRDTWHFVRECRLPEAAHEFAINVSNYRRWPDQVRVFVDLCLDGREGPLNEDYNMRWLAALVGETHRILLRGGVFFYPGDNRKGYEKGRLRYLYECAPVAFLIENAGGLATDGTAPILDQVPKTFHARTPLCFGSRYQMERYAEAVNHLHSHEQPLFADRGLFRTGAR
ncbi:MAG: class 1 fructose-bisphosphatase [Rhizobiales bacterium]|nr:class 1 fructose-bisphosphatase [Hyphomicrobiales bacterium]